MSSSDLPKLWTEPTKIRHNFRKQSFQKISFIKIDLPVGWFLMPKNDFESTNFANFEEVVHNLGRSDNDVI